MAIIYTYPKTADVAAGDLLIISKTDTDESTFPTRSISISDLAKYLTPFNGSGTTNFIPKFKDGNAGLVDDSIMQQKEVDVSATNPGSTLKYIEIETDDTNGRNLSLGQEIRFIKDASGGSDVTHGNVLFGKALDAVNTKYMFVAGRNNTVRGEETVLGTFGQILGTGNSIYTDTNDAPTIILGQQNKIGVYQGVGNPSEAWKEAIVIGSNIEVGRIGDLNLNPQPSSVSAIFIGRNLRDQRFSSLPGFDYAPIVIGRNNDGGFDTNGVIPQDYDTSNLEVGVVVAAGSSQRRNALIITNQKALLSSQFILPTVGKYLNYADKAAAQAAGVPLYGLYRIGDDIKIMTP